MKKIINLFVLFLFNIAIILSVGIFILKPGINTLKKGFDIKILTGEEVQKKKNKISNKYDIKQQELVELLNEKEFDLDNKYQKIEEEINEKFTKKMTEDGWFEEQEVKNDEITKFVTTPKSNESMALFEEKHSKDLELKKQKENEISKINTNSFSKKITILKGIGICFVGILIIIILISKIASIFNKLIYNRNKVNESWAQIEVQLKKRYDLIPNLVNVVKGYTKHEKDTLESIVDIRTQALNNSDVNKEIELNKNINASLQKIIALQEAYPELKADKNYLSLQNDLRVIENEISSARNIYNNSVLKYKNIKDTFPNNMFASVFNFNDVSYFGVSDEEKKNVEIKL